MIKVDDLEICFSREKEQYIAVTDISYEVASGEILGIVGESGCGKSISSLAIMGLLPENGVVTNGKMTIDEEEYTDFSAKNLIEVRGQKISMIFQEPMTALNPLMIVGKQIQEAYTKYHKESSTKEAYAQTLEIMRKVGLSRVEKLYKDYPHQLSGGMRQRIVIAMALVNKPSVVIADEPTTALDVTIQAQILELLKKLNKEEGTSVVFISHNLGIIKELCDKIIVMYAGHIVEEGKLKDVFKNPLHPYTKGLMDSIPTAGKKGQRLYSIEGIVPNLYDRNHEACCFKDRCQYATEECSKSMPQMQKHKSHRVRCFYVEQQEV